MEGQVPDEAELVDAVTLGTRPSLADIAYEPQSPEEEEESPQPPHLPSTTPAPTTSASNTALAAKKTMAAHQSTSSFEDVELATPITTTAPSLPAVATSSSKGGPATDEPASGGAPSTGPTTTTITAAAADGVAPPSSPTPVSPTVGLMAPPLLAAGEGVDSPRTRKRKAISRTHTMCDARYLGCVPVDAPNSVIEINRNVTAKMADRTDEACEVVLCIPRLVGGRIHVMDLRKQSALISFPVRSILFCAGAPEHKSCFGFTSTVSRAGHSHDARLTSVDGIGDPVLRKAVAPGLRDIQEAGAQESPRPADGSAGSSPSGSPDKGSASTASTTPPTTPSTPAPTAFYAHLFQLTSVIKKDYAIQCIAQAFGKQSGGEPRDGNSLDYEFDVAVGISEADAKGNHAFCPMAKDVFKLRADHERHVVVTIAQLSTQPCVIERCFGLLAGLADDASGDADTADGADADEQAAPPAELTAMDVISSEEQPGDGRTCMIKGRWQAPPSLQAETPKDAHVTFRLAVDLVLTGLSEPVRFERTIKVRLFRSNERFWLSGKRESVPRAVEVKLKTSEGENGMMTYEAEYVRLKEQTQANSYMSRFNKMLKSVTADWKGSEEDLLAAEDVFEEDELVVSGSGKVDRDVTGTSLDSWGDLLSRWDASSYRNKCQLIYKGCPDALRLQVWQRLCGGPDTQVVEAYRFLINKESPSERVKAIRWDLTRTFPAHEYFRDSDGTGQQLLYNINKAYSVYDEEIGYCQGLSFISAVLLLHMPEEEAFTVFVKIMFDCGMRELFKSGFELLHIKFAQLTDLIEEQIPDLFAHFKEQGIEVHMFASQWFLTLYATKFSLPVVFRVMDVFLLEGISVLFRVALALLKNAKKDLLALEFEGILNYFRTVLPRVYQTDAHASVLMKAIFKTKISPKRLARSEKEFLLRKAEEEHAQDPVVRLTEEVERLNAEHLRLETETETLAQKLVGNKIEMQGEIDRHEELNRRLTNEVRVLKARLQRVTEDSEEDKARLEKEASQVKGMYRTDLATAEERHAELTAQSEALEAENARLAADNATQKEQLLEHERIKHARDALDDEGSDRLELQARLHDTELELAAVKLSLVESECRCQGLEQQLAAATSVAKEAKRKSTLGWFAKNPKPPPGPAPAPS